MKPHFADSAAPQAAAILVGINFAEPQFAAQLAEARELILSAGAKLALTLTGKRHKPDPATFAGSGKVEEIAEAVARTNASLVVFNHQLSPIQIRNVANIVGVRVIDRTDLILDIFAQRARSAEGKLQVELAQMQHLMTRLVKGWTHLERQRGGISVRGGPGESQLELDRRMVGEKVKKLKDKLKKLGRQRSTQRASRRHAGTFSVSIVGYTNAGKSTLFNSLTRSDAYVADQLFATLDTTTRRLYIAPNVGVTLSDTVGFIRNLPHGLVAAFHATLIEAMEADLLLHVVDAANPMCNEQIAEVNKVLTEIGAEFIPQVLVYNKIDLLECASTYSRVAAVLRDESGKISECRVSAVSGAGMNLLREMIHEYFRGCAEHQTQGVSIDAGLESFDNTHLQTDDRASATNNVVSIIQAQEHAHLGVN